MKPDLVSVVTAHMVYFCAFTRSDSTPKNARKLGVGHGEYDAGVNGLSVERTIPELNKSSFHSKSTHKNLPNVSDSQTFSKRTP